MHHTTQEELSGGVLEPSPVRSIVLAMKMGATICSECRAGFRRVELESERGSEGEYRCPLCSTLLEKFDGHSLIAYRLTVVPPKYLEGLGGLERCPA
jgi:DNA-directed RNA polymerase subunit RPC12/RpoP